MAVLFIALLCMQLLAVYAVDGDNVILTEPIETLNDTETTGSSQPEWSYDAQDPLGPNGWGKIPEDAACAGKDQSPIDIQTANTILQQGTPLTTYSYETYSAKSIIIIDNGHTVNIKFDFDFDNTDINMIPHISGFRLNSTYVLNSIHFHFGNKSTEGSEHAINGQHLAMEAHMVHIKYGYKTLDEALLHPEGVSVLGVLFKIGGNVNNDLKDLMQSISQVKFTDQQVSIKPFNLYAVFPKNYGTMFTYMGSLTTPPCTGTVVWNVVYQNSYIDSNDMAIFHSLHRTSENYSSTNDLLIEENFRQIQPLNGRPVYRQSQSLELELELE